MVWAALVLVAVCLMQTMQFQEALRDVAEALAHKEGRTQPAKAYLISITPPLLSNLWIILALTAVALVSWEAYSSGIWMGIAAIGAFLCVTILSGALAPRPKPATYQQWMLHSLINREANYRRRGDAMRADAVKHFIEMIMAMSGYVTASMLAEVQRASAHKQR